MNKQPFYHRCTILFTATEPMTEEDVLENIQDGLTMDIVIKDSIQIEEFDDPEPGDPADLM